MQMGLMDLQPHIPSCSLKQRLVISVTLLAFQLPLVRVGSAAMSLKSPPHHVHP